MTRLGRLMLAVLAVAALAPSAAAKLPTLSAAEIARGVGPAVSSPRYVAFLEEGTRLRVLDSVEGDSVAVDVPDGCALADVNSGSVLLQCPGGANPMPLILRAADGRRAPLPWQAAVSAAEQRGVVLGVHAIGRFWVGLRVYTPHSSERWYLDRQTGEIRPDPAGPGLVADLDLPRLSRSLCSPLGRDGAASAPGDLSVGAFAPFLYERPFGVGLGERTLTIERCGRRRPDRVRCAPACADVQLGARALSWRSGERALVRELSCDTTYRVRTRTGRIVSVGHTRRWAIASAALPSGRIAILKASRERSSCGS